MSNWSSTQLTSLGQALEAKVTAGTTTLVFTKMKLGSGNTTPGDIAAMTDLTAPEMVLGISSCAVSEADSTVCEVVAVASSSDVVSSFAVREMGLFATDPDEGEILYAVSIDTVPDTMPNNTVASPVTVSYQMDIIAANAANVTAIINPAGLVTARILQAHNDSISAHKMAHWYRQNSKIYAVGDIAFSASLPSYLVLECTTAGTTAASEPDFSGAVEGGTVTDGGVVWTYKTLVGGGLDREQIPAFNHRDVITTSGTYTAPVEGWYKITVKGGGGGGAGSRSEGSSFRLGGGGGGEGGTTLAYEYMTAGDTASVVIGGGGTGGANGQLGGNGGDTSVVVNSNTYTGGGGNGGGQDTNYALGFGGAGGNGTIVGSAGTNSLANSTNDYANGGNGGGAGGSISYLNADSANGVNGGGGAGGTCETGAVNHSGGNGGDGYAWFEYFAAV